MASTRNLFGGAIKALVPSFFVDASELRQIPDNQEVFLDQTSDVSVIVEVLEKVQPTDLDEAVRFHFESLAYDNSAESAIVEEVILNDSEDSTLKATQLTGVQLVRKFNRPVPDEVHILMALYRIEEKNIDLVITFNIPTRTNDSGQVLQAPMQQAKEAFSDLVRSLQIVDYGLFA